MDKPKFRGLRLPNDSRVPDPSTGAATSGEYDTYFTLERTRVDLREWTADCLSVEQDLLRDLPDSGLSEEERRQIAEGLVVLHRTTLEQWTRSAAASAQAGGERREGGGSA
jgi:hypothetical protein